MREICLEIFYLFFLFGILWKVEVTYFVLFLFRWWANKNKFHVMLLGNMNQNDDDTLCIAWNVMHKTLSFPIGYVYFVCASSFTCKMAKRKRNKTVVWETPKKCEHQTMCSQYRIKRMKEFPLGFSAHLFFSFALVSFWYFEFCMLEMPKGMFWHKVMIS